MQGDQTRRTGCVDGHGRALPVIKIRHAIGQNGRGSTSSVVLGQAVDAPYGSELVIEAHAAHEHSGRRPAKLLHRVTGRFNTFVHCLEKHALLGIHGLSLLWINGKEVAIKGPGVLVQKIGVLDVRALSPTSQTHDF